MNHPIFLWVQSYTTSLFIYLWFISSSPTAPRGYHHFLFSKPPVVLGFPVCHIVIFPSDPIYVIFPFDPIHYHVITFPFLICKVPCILNGNWGWVLNFDLSFSPFKLSVSSTSGLEAGPGFYFRRDNTIRSWGRFRKEYLSYYYYYLFSDFLIFLANMSG